MHLPRADHWLDFALDARGLLLWERKLPMTYEALTHPDGMCIMNSGTPLLVIASDGGAAGFNLSGELLFSSAQPFELCGCDEVFCYGSDGHQTIQRMDPSGRREVLYSSPDTLIGRVLLGSDGRIYALTSGKVTVVKRNGEAETSFPVPGKIISLMAVAEDRVFGVTTSSVLALQNWRPRR